MRAPSLEVETDFRFDQTRRWRRAFAAVHLSESFRHTAERMFLDYRGACQRPSDCGRRASVRFYSPTWRGNPYQLRLRQYIGAGSRVILVRRYPALLGKKITMRATLTAHHKHVSSQPELCTCIARSPAPSQVESIDICTISND
jgi:hypothetical protein